MTNPYIGENHTFWLELLYKQQEKRRTNSVIPVKAFNELKALGCVTGEPARAVITPHGSGMLLTIRNDKEAAKQASKKRRKSR